MVHFVAEPDWESLCRETLEEHFKLILLVGGIGSGKSARLEQAATYGFGCINMGEALGSRLLPKPRHLLSAAAEELAIDLIGQCRANRVAIDNTEILFEHPLKLNPLALLKRLSIERLIVATWTGIFTDSRLTYGIKGHPAFREYKYSREDTYTIIPVEPTA